jgi:hypothetical protein
MFDWTSGGSVANKIDFLADSLAGSVADDDAFDTLYGEAGDDWFLILARDNARDKKGTDIVRGV